MKKLLFSITLFVFIISAGAQVSKTDVLQNLEKERVNDQIATATVRSASRLFADRNDLSSVITIIPSGSLVELLDSDSTYLHVVYDGNEGYISSAHAFINKVPATAPQNRQPVRETTGQPQQKMDRLTWLEKKYGSRTARKIYEGKIWKGMSAEMVKDSWGSPQKISRNISGNMIKEEWFYRGTWLYIQNSVLAEWGPVK